MVTAPVVTRLASTLADAGLVERREDAKDRRTVLLALTRVGRRRVRAMRRDLLAAAHELLEPLPEERRAAIAAALEELQVLLPEHSARR
jgi:DNA-binding MarR family transcriptional regulator